MDTIEPRLLERWQTLTRRAAWADAGAEALGADLVSRYAEPHRYYHGTAHLLAVLVALDDLCDPDDPPVVATFAAWFHDAIYRGEPTVDETASAELARRELAASPLAIADRESVASMVLATASHLDPSAEHDADTALLLDADLSILAAPAAVYDAYAAGVRAEHPGADDETFRRGRLRVVESLIGRPTLFMTAEGVSRYDAPARANLRRERRSLLAAAPQR